jgi:MarR family 2-MHQ and catechol resistance regulon transcriptional repressor
MFGVSDSNTEVAVATYVKLMRAARAVTARVEPRLAAHGLTVTQLGVLEVLLHKGPLSHRDLGRKVLTSAANMTDVIDKLAARDLVRRVRCPEDRRQVKVELTSCGQSVIETLFPLHAADIAEAMAGLDTAALEQLGALLRTLGMAATRGPAEGDLAKSAIDDHLPSRPFDIEQSCDAEQGECHDTGAAV